MSNSQSSMFGILTVTTNTTTMDSYRNNTIWFNSTDTTIHLPLEYASLQHNHRNANMFNILTMRGLSVHASVYLPVFGYHHKSNESNLPAESVEPEQPQMYKFTRHLAEKQSTSPLAKNLIVGDL